MLRPNFPGAVMAALLFMACGAPPAPRWQEATRSPFVTGPYLIGAPGGGVVVALKASLPRPPTVDWWPVAAGETAARQVSAVREKDLWVAELRGLPADQSIAYRVRSAAGDTAIKVFRTGPAAGTRFRFAAYGDTRTGHSVHRAVVEAVAREQVSFVLHTGDMVHHGGVQSEWDTFFQISRPLLDHVPIIPATGNHDIGGRKYFPHYFQADRVSEGRGYRVHDWGNLRVLVIDVGIECRSGCTQYWFAERALAEGAARGMMMVISVHYPPYSSGQHGSHEGTRDAIISLARRHGVELVIAGHDHNYERTRSIDGVTYVVSGSAGAPIRPVRPQWFTAHARTEPHYVLVDVDRNQLTVRAVNLRGSVFDAVTLRNTPPLRVAGTR